jgi:DNA modification methylase
VTNPARRIEYAPLSEVKAAKVNPKDHDLGELMVSIRRFGFSGSVIVDERTGRLISGHGRIDALRALQKEKAEAPEGIEVRDGEWFVPVERGWRSKSDADADAMIIAANRLVESGGWNADVLDAMLVELSKIGESALEGIGYDADDVDKILRDMAKDAGGPQPDEQEGGELAGPLYVKEGELWVLGDHRVLVGDSTKPEDVKRLLDGQQADAVITDPPYAIYGSSSGIGSDIADDKMVRPFFEAVGRLCRENVKTFGHVYLCTDWRSWAALWEGVKRAELQPKGCIVWDKGNGGMGSMWANCYELVGFFVNTPKQKTMKSGAPRGQRQAFKPNIQRFPRVAGDEREFNAQKPVGLMRELVDAATDKGELVVDFFCGSGSTLIACEQTGRRCFTMELEPKHAQITIERWKRLTGKQPVRVDHQV